MATDILWPHDLLRPRAMLWSPAGSAYEGGRPFSGAAPQAIDFSGGGLWKARLIDVALRTREQINAWHALEALLAGGVQTAWVPRCDRRHGPSLPGPRSAGVPHSDGSPFSDGTLYDAPDLAATVAAAALRATTVRLFINGGRPLIGGEHFSIDHGDDVSWRLYRIARVTDLNDGVATAEIRPPLRAAVSADAPVEFRLPRCVMRLADPAGMELTVEMLRRATASVDFRESLA